MVTAFRDLDVGRGLGRGQDARRGLVVQIGRQRRGCTVPGCARKAPLFFAKIALGTRRRRRAQDLEQLRPGRSGRHAQACCLQHLLKLASADHGIDFRDVLADLVAVALHQAAGDDQLLRASRALVLRHFQNGIHRFLLGGVDKRTGIHHQDFSRFRLVGQLGAGAVQQAHHHFAVHQVFRAAQAHKPDRWTRERAGKGRGSVACRARRCRTRRLRVGPARAGHGRLITD